MTAAHAIRKIRSPLPAGSFTLGAGVAVYGLTAYGFLIITARALGPERYATLSVYWAMLYLLAPGIFLPLEQETSRIVASRSAAGRMLIGRAAAFGAAAWAVLTLAAAAGWDPLLRRLFDGQGLLLVGLSLGLLSYAAQHLVRGILTGSHDFVPYSLVLTTEGTLRLLAAGLLALGGVAVAGPYAVVVAVAPLLSLAAAARAMRRVRSPGPSVRWSELTRALGYLLSSSILAQYLAVGAPVAVKLLAAPGEEVQAGRMLASLVVTRIPLFLFQAVQPPLLARLSSALGAGDAHAYRAGVVRIVKVVVVLGVATVLGALALGPFAVNILFGASYTLGRIDLTALAGGTAALMLAIALAQALIAASFHSRAALAWLIGAVTFTVATALGDELLVRVEVGFLLGSVAAAAAMGVLLAGTMRRIQPEQEGPPLTPMVIEP